MTDEPEDDFDKLTSSTIFQDMRDLYFYKKNPKSIFLKRMLGMLRLDLASDELEEVDLKEVPNEVLEMACNNYAGQASAQFCYMIAHVLDTTPVTAASMDFLCDVNIHKNTLWSKSINCVQELVYVYDDEIYKQPLLEITLLNPGMDDEQFQVLLRNVTNHQYQRVPKPLCSTVGQLAYICIWHKKDGIAGK